MDFDGKLNFLKRLLGECKFISRSKEADFFCPFCSPAHHRPKLAINLDRDRYQCWVCGNKGRSLVPIIRKVGSSRDIQEYLDHFKAKDVKSTQFDPEVATFKVDLPEHFVPVTEEKNSIFGKKAYDYLTKHRKLTDEDILRHKIGTAFDGEYANRIIFPSFDKRGLPNFFTSRTYEGKYWSPITPKGFKFSIILNELNLDFTKPMVIVEGFGDMYKSIDNCAVLCGSSLPEDALLFKTIVQNNTPIFMALDPDARDKSNRIAKSLMRYGVSVYDVSIEPYKDVGEMCREEFLRRFEAAKSTDNNQILRERMRNI